MQKKVILVFIIFISKISYQATINSIHTARVYPVLQAFSMCVDPYYGIFTTTERGENLSPCFWANMNIDQTDVRNSMWTYEVINETAGEVKEIESVIIDYDSKKCCPSSGCTEPFPQGYAFKRYDDLNNEWQIIYCISSLENLYVQSKVSRASKMLCDWKIGNYRYNLYENGVLKQSTSFTVYPSFSTSDKFYLYAYNLSGLPWIYNDGTEFQDISIKFKTFLFYE